MIRITVSFVGHFCVFSARFITIVFKNTLAKVTELKFDQVWGTQRGSWSWAGQIYRRPARRPSRHNKKDFTGRINFQLKGRIGLRTYSAWHYSCKKTPMVTSWHKNNWMKGIFQWFQGKWYKNCVCEHRAKVMSEYLKRQFLNFLKKKCKTAKYVVHELNM